MGQVLLTITQKVLCATHAQCENDDILCPRDEEGAIKRRGVVVIAIVVNRPKSIIPQNVNGRAGLQITYKSLSLIVALYVLIGSRRDEEVTQRERPRHNI